MKKLFLFSLLFSYTIQAHYCNEFEQAVLDSNIEKVSQLLSEKTISAEEHALLIDLAQHTFLKCKSKLESAVLNPFSQEKIIPALMRSLKKFGAFTAGTLIITGALIYKYNSSQYSSDSKASSDIKTKPLETLAALNSTINSNSKRDTTIAYCVLGLPVCGAIIKKIIKEQVLQLYQEDLDKSIVIRQMLLRYKITPPSEPA